MNKLILGTAIAGTAVVALAATSMVLTDNQVDNVIGQLTSQNIEPFTVALVKDENSFFERTVTIALSFDDGQMPVVVNVENQLSKKPWGTEIVHTVSLDDSVLVNIEDASVRELLQKYLIDQPMLNANTQVSMTGTYQTEVETLSVQDSIENIAVVLHPMVINAKGNMSGALDMTGQWSGLSVNSDDLEQVDFSFLPMQFSAEGKYLNGSVFDGQQLVTGEGFRFNLESEWESQSIEGGPYELTSVGDVVDTNFNGGVTFVSEGLSIQNEDSPLSVDDIRMSFGMTGIDVAAYQALVEELNQMQLTGVPSSEMMESANILLQNGFGLTLDDWYATVEGHSVALNASFELPENEISDVNNPFTLLGLVGQLSASADLSMDSALADIPEISDALLSVLMTGAIVSEGDEYKMSFSMENGVAKLNGEVLPLPF